MKHIIGLDLGTNSIGWALLESEEVDANLKIVDLGVNVFPIGTIVDEKTGKEKTKNEQRRGYRGASRMRYRYKLRREHLSNELKEIGIYPDYDRLHKLKGEKQSYELYELRSKALDGQIPKYEIGRIFMLLNKYRGFLSNAKKLKKNSEDGAVKSDISKLEDFIYKSNARTIGEYFYFMHKQASDLYDRGKWHNPNEPIDERAYDDHGELILHNSNGIRRRFGRYTHRDMYKKEFDLIWSTQMAFYPELTGSPFEFKNIMQLPHREKIRAIKDFKQTAYWKIKEYSIYYQRPLKSQKKYVSNCQFEKNKKVIPVSHPLYQEFRIYKNLLDLRFSNEENYNERLPLDWVEKLANALKKIDVLHIKPNKVTKEKVLPTFYSVLGINTAEVEFKSEIGNEEKFIYGNRTFAGIIDSIGLDAFNDLVDDGKIGMLWHHLYIAKDGLLKEDDWLKGILKEKWGFKTESVIKLIENGLEEDYGSYSTKVLKKILPFMRRGNDEHSSLVMAGYLDDDSQLNKIVTISESMKQLKYQELRNPVVEKAVSQAIKVVNAILNKYKNEIDRDQLEIRIESTRELKKPREQRETQRRDNLRKEKIRKEYANFLNSKKDLIGLRRKIEKNDSLISKFELWLEMGLDHTDTSFSENDFNSFQKITRPDDRLKHKLWLECNRICPYSSKVIPLGKLFSPEIEIEHIIPLSRCLDDSFNNKTLTFENINKEKGARTSFEYIKSLDRIKQFKDQLKRAFFSEQKMKQFLREDMPTTFDNSQLSNTSYIAKFTRKKMMEVCRKVYFTNGVATSELRRNDWQLSDMLDKIRYLEYNGIDIQINIDNYLMLKKSFENWLRKKHNSTDFKKIDWSKLNENEFVSDYIKDTKNEILHHWDEIQKFQQFRNRDGKKDRSDNRHHAIDAIVIAATSNSVTQKLSSFNAIKEENHYGKRETIECPFDKSEIRAKVSGILINHNIKQALITKRKNKIKTRDGFVVHSTYAPQGKLHQESFYGYVNDDFRRRVDLYSDDRPDKALFESKSDLDYTVKGISKWHYIPDEGVYNVIKQRIDSIGKDSLSKDNLEKVPLYMRSYVGEDHILSKKHNKPLPVIKSVRKKFNVERSLINIPAKDSEGKVKYENRYADNDSNYMMVFYERRKKDKKGNPVKSEKAFEIISFFDAVNYKRKQIKKFFRDEIEGGLGLNPDCNWVKIGDAVVLYVDENDKNAIDWGNQLDLKRRLYVVKGLSSSLVFTNGKGYEFGYISLLKSNRNKAQSYPNEKDISVGIMLDSFKVSHLKFQGLKVKLTTLGEVEKYGSDCFSL